MITMTAICELPASPRFLHTRRWSRRGHSRRGVRRQASPGPPDRGVSTVLAQVRDWGEVLGDTPAPGEEVGSGQEQNLYLSSRVSYWSGSGWEDTLLDLLLIR